MILNSALVLGFSETSFRISSAKFIFLLPIFKILYYFKLNFVELPDYLIRNYRLTLDYQEDLDMFNIVDKHFTDNDLEGNVTELFNFTGHG